MKKISLKRAAACALAVAVCALAAAFFHMRYPEVQLTKSTNAGGSEENHVEQIVSYTFESSLIPPSPKVVERWKTFGAWNDAVLQEIASYPTDQPRSIQVSGEVAQGKTTLRYEGYLTDAAGNRVDFRQERTFDFVLDRTPFAA